MAGTALHVVGRLRVLHLIKGLSLGGAEQLVVHLVEAGDQRAFEYSVAYAVAGLDDLVGPLQAAGVEVHFLRGRSHFDLRWALRLRRLLVAERFDIVHLHLPYTASVGRIVAWSLGRTHRPRLVHTQHNIWGHSDRVTRFLGRLTWWMDDADIVVSQAALEALPPALARRSEVLLHGIDRASPPAPGTREEIRTEFGVVADEVMVVTVANFRPEKGYDVLLGAARELIEEGLSVRFVAVGHGPLEDETRAEHRRLGLGDRFIFTGLRRDVARVLAGADVFVLASHHEGFPVAVMEALVAGVPVVATAVGDVPSAVHDGIDGLIVSPGDPRRLAAALRTIIVDRERRATMTAAVRERTSRFDIRTASTRVEEIYRHVVAQALR